MAFCHSDIGDFYVNVPYLQNEVVCGVETLWYEGRRVFLSSQVASVMDVLIIFLHSLQGENRFYRMNLNDLKEVHGVSWFVCVNKRLYLSDTCITALFINQTQHMFNFSLCISNYPTLCCHSLYANLMAIKSAM